MSLSTLPVVARWGVLIALSVLFAALLTWARLLAALLLGAMLAGHPRRKWRRPASSCRNCLLASRKRSRRHLHDIWLAFLPPPFFILFCISGRCFLGHQSACHRCQLRVGLDHQQVPHLPETTAIWGLLPGAASAMMVMADAYGIDARLVVFMQYVRVVMVAIVASIIARLWVHAPAVAAATPEVWFAPIHALRL